MTSDDLAHQRLLNQQIAHPTCTQPRDVVHGLGAVQAQEYRSALWAVGLRSPPLNRLFYATESIPTAVCLPHGTCSSAPIPDCFPRAARRAR
jgi:hypothetical protein